jgi:L-ascorbate metabolism protein UlaG (beta-lactamase superfamily)
MDIQFYGANCVVISTKQVRIVIDDNLAVLGAKSVTREAVPGAKMLIDMPGEYEISGISVYAYQARAHMDTDKERNAVMYKLTYGDVKVLVTGHVYPKLSEAKLEDIGIVDVMVIPVGGNGYTLDSAGALQVIKAIEPKVIVPTHYDDSSLNFEVPQQRLEDVLKVIGMEAKEPVKKLQCKPSEFSEGTQLVVLEKS